MVIRHISFKHEYAAGSVKEEAVGVDEAGKAELTHYQLQFWKMSFINKAHSDLESIFDYWKQIKGALYIGIMGL